MASVLGMRFFFAFAMMAIGPGVVGDLLRRTRLLDAPVNKAEEYEGPMFAWLATCVALTIFAWWQPVACAWRPLQVRRVLAVFVPAEIVWILFLLAYLAAARSFGSPVPPQWGLEYFAGADLTRPGYWFVVAGICIAAPLAEEIVFRGYLMGSLLCVMPKWAAIAIGAAVFGAVHGLPYAIPIGVLGALFGWLRVRHGCLLPSILAHALHNIVGVVVTTSWPQSLDLLYPR